ncbi:MAG: TOBE domain-containing protein [Thermodesulfobacteriota bacterium]|nr:TOBE domain-containing protein [Thermodesulfobacteriota bacterium]
MKNIFSIRHKGSSSVTISQNGCDIEIATGSTRYIPDSSHVAFRPEDITLSDVPPSAQFLEGTITALGAREFFYDVYIDAQGGQFTARCTRQNIVRQNLTPETQVFISIPPGRLHFF